MISEGEGFMDALNSASNPLPLTMKKTKRRPTKPTPTTVSSSSKSPQNTEIITGDGEFIIAVMEYESDVTML